MIVQTIVKSKYAMSGAKNPGKVGSMVNRLMLVVPPTATDAANRLWTGALNALLETTVEYGVGTAADDFDTHADNVLSVPMHPSGRLTIKIDGGGPDPYILFTLEGVSGLPLESVLQMVATKCEHRFGVYAHVH